MLLEGAMDWTDLGLLVAGAILGYLVQVIGDGWRNVSDDHELWADLRSTTLEAQPGSVGGTGLPCGHAPKRRVPD